MLNSGRKAHDLKVPWTTGKGNPKHTHTHAHIHTRAECVRGKGKRCSNGFRCDANTISLSDVQPWSVSSRTLATRTLLID